MSDHADRGDWRNAAHGYRDQRDELQRKLADARHRAARVEATDGAVQIAISAINMRRDGPLNARNIVTALARAGWLHDPDEIAALYAALDTARAPQPGDRETR